jgi:DNA-binding GntR family transcriptional regulator
MTPDTDDDTAIDLDDDRPDDPPMYVQITQDLMARIHDGRISHAAPLPSAHQLAEEHRVSTTTIRRGLRLLADLGFARHVPGHPYQAIRPALPRGTAGRL